MTPEQQAMLTELYTWMKARKAQPLVYPVDEASKNALGALTFVMPGTTAKTQVYVDSGGDSVTAPKAYVQTLVVSYQGNIYEIPSIT